MKEPANPPIARESMNTNRSIVTFDIGGTWFRSGIFTLSNQLMAVTRQPALNYKTHPNFSIEQLQERLANYIIDETYRLREQFPSENLCLASISMGAALNAHTGFIWNSGPLWGPNCVSFDLISTLNKKAPDIYWTMVNDVTAVLLRHVLEYKKEGLSRLAVVTVSSGIAFRTYDTRLQLIPVDANYGLQGEIGHIPINFEYQGHSFDLPCACGKLNHLNAFCSGQGIETVLVYLADRFDEDFKGSLLYNMVQGVTKQLKFNHFAEAVSCNDPFAVNILDAVTSPLARIFIHLFTIDPEIERVILTGGVVHTLQNRYLDSLLKQLSAIGLYQISSQNPNFFRDRFQIELVDDNSGMIGAAIAARMKVQTPMPVFVGSHCEWSVNSQLPVNYKVIECNNLFAFENREILLTNNNRQNVACRRFVVIDDQVERFYGHQIRDYFSHHNIMCRFLVLSISEQTKTIAEVLHVVDELTAFGLLRRYEPIIAIGGGVLLDIVGFAASIFRRGVPFIRVPTTLVGLIDAGIGVKTGVNVQAHKNRLGTYYAPLATFLDRSFLKTLDIRHIRNGLAEILKVAVVRDEKLFELLEDYGSALLKEKFQTGEVATLVLRRAVQGMLEELEPNLWEHNLNRLMDFGHSLSPTIEMESLPHLLHGEAVSIDMAFSLVLANKRGLLTISARDRVLNLMKTLDLPIIHESCDPATLYQALQDTIKHRDGLQRLPLPIGIGSARFFNDISFQEVVEAFLELQELAGG